MMRILWYLSAVVISLGVILGAGCAGQVQPHEVIYFTNSISEDATPAVLKKILEKGKNSISEIKFEAGTYHFYPDKGIEKYCYISNHCDLMVKTAFPIEGMENVVIDGQGSSFIFHGVIIPFLIENSKNITVKNLSIDWEVPFHSECKVVANDIEKKTFDIEISDQYPYEIRNGELIFIKEGYEHTLGQTILYDPQRKAIAFDTESYTPLTDYQRVKDKNGSLPKYKYEVDHRSPEYRTGFQKRLVAEQLKPGLVRIHHHFKKIPQVGMILTAKGEQGYNRIAPAFRLTKVSNFEATNVTVHHAGGMGLIAENCKDIVLDGFNVIPSNGRMVSTTADATHFVGCRGKVTLQNCTFQNQLDDASNIHGTYQKIVDVLADNKLGVRMGHHQQQGFVVGEPHDTLGLVRLSDSFFPYHKVTIKHIQYVNSRFQIITLNEKLPEDVEPGDLVENLCAYPELEVKNCNISNNRARGLLISTPKKALIENNYFSTEMEALLIPVESSHWYESGNASNLTIKNNKFRNCGHGGLNAGVIRFVTDDDNKNTAFTKIEISGNEIEHFDNLILEVANTDGLLFKNNTISHSSQFKQLHTDNAAIHLKSSKNIVFENNDYKGSAKSVVRILDEMKPVEFH